MQEGASYAGEQVAPHEQWVSSLVQRQSSSCGDAVNAVDAVAAVAAVQC